MDVIQKATNIVWHSTQVERSDREAVLKQSGLTVWFTGLPSSGKSTTAFTLERELIRRGHLAYVLDGDNVRHGLNKDLAFSDGDRVENIRRVAEVAKLFADAGIIAITSFISPDRQQRAFARRIHYAAGLEFLEVHVDTPLEVCEMRDPKGMYKKARKGEIKDFTGVDAPYEAPDQADIVIQTAKYEPDEIIEQIIGFFYDNGILPLPAETPSMLRRA